VNEFPYLDSMVSDGCQRYGIKGQRSKSMRQFLKPVYGTALLARARVSRDLSSEYALPSLASS
jgi:hypothetical protein